MNKTIAITAIVFVAVVMVIGAVSPVMANDPLIHNLCYSKDNLYS